MTPTTVDQSKIVKLTTDAFKVFCDDISGMFSVKMDCAPGKIRSQNAGELKEQFKKIAAVYSIKAEGALEGTFQFIFDKEGVFTLGGVVVMLPEDEIEENRKNGTQKDLQQINSAIGEVGNLLISAWDRKFHDELEGHGSFGQGETFVGDIWENSEKKTVLSSNEEIVFVPFEVTVGSFPAFMCGAIFPNAVFGAASEEAVEETVEAPEEETAETTVEETQETASEDTAEEVVEESTEDAVEAVVEETSKGASEEVAAETAETANEEAIEETTEEAVDEAAEPAAEETTEKPTDDTAEEAVEESPEAASEEPVEEAVEDTAKETAETEADEQPAKRHELVESDVFAESSIVETIKQMTTSAADLPGEELPPDTLGITAKEIMQENVLWIGPDDSVQDALAKMQQAETGYLVVGQDERAQGIVSKSDINGAISPYLRPMFAKWHRPLDDSSLQIRIKWIMSRPVRTITPDTTLAVIIENMCRFGGRCLPVTGEDGKICGMVSVFDILKALLKQDKNISVVGETTPTIPAAEDIPS